MFNFDNTDWAQEIADETGKEEYQNATIRIQDTSLLTINYDDILETGEPTITGEADIYTGRARIIGVRWGVQHGGESQGNAYSEKSIRVQVPYQSVGRVKKGCKVYIVSSPRNPVLEDLVFTVSADFQGSMAASRTIECALNSDVVAPEVTP